MKRKSSQLSADGVADVSALRNPWHYAFYEALQMELLDYHDVLEFEVEHHLTEEPLRIDCVVVKKTKDVEIKKNIAAIFRDWKSRV
jgi:hypothetical protein